MNTPDARPDPSVFHVTASDPTEWRVRMSVAGDVELRIQAATMAEATAMATRAVQELHSDSATVLSMTMRRIDVGEVWQRQPLYLVTRQGRPLQVSHLEPGDVPRAPNAHGQ